MHKNSLAYNKLFVIAPYIWLIAFSAIPFCIVILISFSQSIIDLPPYIPAFSYKDFYLGNYHLFFTDSIYFTAYLRSILIALSATICCLVLGYPIAYQIARSPKKIQHILLVAIVVPFWTSLLIRIYAWMTILSNNGLLNHVLLAIGVIKEPITILDSKFAVILGITYSYLPFMVLPIYACLEKMNRDLENAASDLGANPIITFLKVTLPLSLPGIIGGVLLVFVPAIGEFVIPDLMGGAKSFVISKALWNEFFLNRNWPMASAVAVAITTAVVLPTVLIQKILANKK